MSGHDIGTLEDVVAANGLCSRHPLDFTATLYGPELRRAQAVCARCPVREGCEALGRALASPTVAPPGLWGGLRGNQIRDQMLADGSLEAA